jgi:hypothetical protein
MKRPLAVPLESESGPVTDEVSAFRFYEGNLPDDEYQDFGITFKLPPAENGTKFWFPVLQKCANGDSMNWSQIPVGSDKPRQDELLILGKNQVLLILRYPSPSVTLITPPVVAGSASAASVGSAAGSTAKSGAMKEVAALSFLTVLFL